MRKLDLAYLAGYFDADGCVSISLNGRTLNVKVSISGRNMPLCTKLKSFFGGGIDVNVHEVVSWNAYSKDAQAFLLYVEPYVEYKQLQVKLSLIILDTTEEPVRRYKAALGVCRLNQRNLAKPQVTKTMGKLTTLILENSEGEQ